MANVGQARGRLAHVQFALSMLEKAEPGGNEGGTLHRGSVERLSALS